MMGIGERIKSRRKELKISVDYIAEKLNVDRSTVYRYESQDIEKFPLQIIEPLAEILKVTPAYLMGWEEIESTTSVSEYKFFPTVKVAAGLPTSVESVLESDVDVLKLPDMVMGRWARNQDIFILKVNGESMNKVLPNQSLIAVKLYEVQNLKDGDIVVFSNNHEYSVKHFYNDTVNRRFIFRPNSTDSSFTDIIVDYDNCDELKIYGKVVVYIVNV